MATSHRRQQTGPERKIVGSFKLTGDEDNTRLTISSNLDPEPFPNEKGTKVSVEFVNPDDGPAFLEVHPHE
ncbi:hypothetical protein [Halomicrobium urmianum]|uniref:hypothetical protein n=1 Tax=Halomicrobium urmianum TaxID=1586233 RepID=UPI001CDA5363|nr:hypothetical protein [Halomicrobium urmianum]